MKEVVHVPTIELAKEVLKVAKENGFKTPKYPVEYYFKVFGCKTCFRIEKNDFRAATKDFYENEGHKVITTEEFLNRYKPKFRPIAMKCSKEQFDAVKGKLVGAIIDDISSFESCSYLVNNYSNQTLVISNINGLTKSNYGRQVLEEYCEKTLLECCGIDVKDEVNELDQLRKENEELKQQLKELQDQPKVGDVCLFWDNGVNEYTLGLLREHSDDSYWSNNSYYHNCILYTDENLKKVIEQIKLNNK